MAWHNAPVSIKPTAPPVPAPTGGDEDTQMGDAGTPYQVKMENDDVYDLAEDDDRWLPE